MKVPFTFSKSLKQFVLENRILMFKGIEILVVLSWTRRGNFFIGKIRISVGFCKSFNILIKSLPMLWVGVLFEGVYLSVIITWSWVGAFCFYSIHGGNSKSGGFSVADLFRVVFPRSRDIILWLFFKCALLFFAVKGVFGGLAFNDGVFAFVVPNTWIICVYCLQSLFLSNSTFF